MNIRLRLTLWYVGLSLTSLAFLGCGLYYELIVERQADIKDHGFADSVQTEIADILLFYGLPVVFVTLAGGWWLTRRILAPVTRLTAAAEKTTLDSLSARLPETGRTDELGRLTEVFNQMLKRLEESFGRVREFTLHASHELKTPLTVMRGELETALREERCTGEQRDLLAGLLDEVHRLAKIVDGLTLLAKADAGQATLQMEPLRFDELVQDSFTDAQVLAHPSAIEVKLNDCDPVVVTGDRHRLRQLLLNLTDNAIKYNQAEGMIEMSLKRNGTEVVLRISNTGPGIPPEKLTRVFDRFFRGDPAHGNEIEGCGLGLAIAQWIVTAHHGRIRINSEPGHMTTVDVRLPLATGQTRAAVVERQ